MGRYSVTPCPCGSGKDSHWQFDARGIELCRTCDDCHETKMKAYRSDVLADPNYEADEDIEGEYEDEEPDYDDWQSDWDGDHEIRFADPGGNSALRAASATNPRNLPCPNCGAANRLTPADRALGYQCDSCADLAERGGY